MGRDQRRGQGDHQKPTCGGSIEALELRAAPSQSVDPGRDLRRQSPKAQQMNVVSSLAERKGREHFKKVVQGHWCSALLKEDNLN